MISCSNQHPCYRQLLMILYMLYMISSFALAFVIVGATFSTIMIFYNYALHTIFLYQSDAKWLINLNKTSFVREFLFATYLTCLVLVLIVSLTLPVDKGIGYFRVAVVILSIMSLLTVTGIVYFATQSPWYLQEEIWDPATETWVPYPYDNPNYTFNYLLLAAIIMLSTYLLPIILRPVDFVRNITSYTFGLISYLLMIPMYLNVLSIYAISNLHDVSWGNRPTGTGTEAFTAAEAEQKKAKEGYLVFRTKMLVFWLLCQVLYYIMALQMMAAVYDKQIINSGKITYLEFLTLYLAAIICFATVFAVLYTIIWWFRYCCLKAYKIEEQDLSKEF